MSADFGRRFCVSVDAQGYGDRDDQRQRALQDGLIKVLSEAADGARLNRDRWDRQPNGDGEVALLPEVNPEPEPRVVDDYVRELDNALSRHNRDLRPEARLRLRVAMHFGVAQLGKNGYTGRAPVDVNRLLDAKPLREALSAAPDANLALILSSRVYEETVQQGYTSLRPSDFRRVSAQLKEFHETAWLRVPGADVHQLALSSGQSSARPHDTRRARDDRNPAVVQEFHDTVHAEHANFGVTFS